MSLAGAMSDATLIARLGNEHTAGPALQQIAERQAMSMQASSSGHPNAMHGWAGTDKYVSSCVTGPLSHLCGANIPYEDCLCSVQSSCLILLWGHGGGQHQVKLSSLAARAACLRAGDIHAGLGTRGAPLSFQACPGPTGRCLETR